MGILLWIFDEDDGGTTEKKGFGHGCLENIFLLLRISIFDFEFPVNGAFVWETF